MKDWGDWLQTIGAIFGILAAIMLVMIQFHQVVNVLRSFRDWIWSLPQNGGQMIRRFRENRWAKEILPDWDIVEVSSLLITRSSDGYNIQLPIYGVPAKSSCPCFD